jgi:hypothetical protein
MFLEHIKKQNATKREQKRKGTYYVKGSELEDWGFYQNRWEVF